MNEQDRAMQNSNLESEREDKCLGSKIPDYPNEETTLSIFYTILELRQKGSITTEEREGYRILRGIENIEKITWIEIKDFPLLITDFNVEHREAIEEKRKGVPQLGILNEQIHFLTALSFEGGRRYVIPLIEDLELIQNPQKLNELSELLSVRGYKLLMFLENQKSSNHQPYLSRRENITIGIPMRSSEKILEIIGSSIEVKFLTSKDFYGSVINFDPRLIQIFRISEFARLLIQEIYNNSPELCILFLRKMHKIIPNFEETAFKLIERKDFDSELKNLLLIETLIFKISQDHDIKEILNFFEEIKRSDNRIQNLKGKKLIWRIFSNERLLDQTFSLWASVPKESANRERKFAKTKVLENVARYFLEDSKSLMLEQECKDKLTLNEKGEVLPTLARTLLFLCDSDLNRKFIEIFDFEIKRNFKGYLLCEGNKDIDFEQEVKSLNHMLASIAALIFYEDMKSFIMQFKADGSIKTDDYGIPLVNYLENGNDLPHEAFSLYCSSYVESLYQIFEHWGIEESWLRMFAYIDLKRPFAWITDHTGAHISEYFKYMEFRHKLNNVVMKTAKDLYQQRCRNV